MTFCQNLETFRVSKKEVVFCIYLSNIPVMPRLYYCSHIAAQHTHHSDHNQKDVVHVCTLVCWQKNNRIMAEEKEAKAKEAKEAKEALLSAASSGDEAKVC
jgi:hypothetical protein